MKFLPLFFALLGTSVVVNAATNIPQNLSVSTGQTLAVQVNGIGVQIYICTPAKEDPTKYAWFLKGPEAELLDLKGKLIGKHYAGPTWEMNDGSKVVGELKEKADSPDTDAIPWLLLTAKSNVGSGVLNGVKSIQRLDTLGGKTPKDKCSKLEAGQEVRVNYKAGYYFYK
jgi:hypothetical protein